ncbi:MAG TPA: YicC family protein [Chromatiaceae bacterium]|nr:YicC family protein [Chromatiaceae bacterium]
MANSMTAFARAERRGDHGELVWEIRSVNHRYLEVLPRLPEELRALEPRVREQAGRRLRRGKLDCTLRFQPASDTPETLRVNLRLVGQLVDAAERVAAQAGGDAALTAIDLLRWPGVIETADQDMGRVQAEAAELLDEALSALVEMRRREGGKLAAMILERCRRMQALVAEIRAMMPAIQQRGRERVLAKLAAMHADLDPDRLEQALVQLVQKMDVDEEQDRLDAHLDEVCRVLDLDEPIGRRLDFLMQELNREANTIASKSADAELTAITVRMKVLIEQMREQVQNIE